MLPRIRQADKEANLHDPTNKEGWLSLYQASTKEVLDSFRSNNESSEDEKDVKEEKHDEDTSQSLFFDENCAVSSLGFAYEPIQRLTKSHLLSPSSGRHAYPSDTESDSEKSYYEGYLSQDTDDSFLFHDKATKLWAWRRRKSMERKRRRENRQFFGLASKMALAWAVCGLGYYLYQYPLKDQNFDILVWAWSCIYSWWDVLDEFLNETSKTKAINEIPGRVLDLDVMLAFT